jgi:hypothetical protein
LVVGWVVVGAIGLAGACVWGGVAAGIGDGDS